MIRDSIPEEQSCFALQKGRYPLVAAAIHAGNNIRQTLRPFCALNSAERLREEDPYTDIWTSIAETTIIVHQSRFEFDLNRPREKAVYLTPEDAWGLTVWKTPPTQEQVQESLARYDNFYSQIERLFRELEREHGRFVVFDLHSYNYQRTNTYNEPEELVKNPEINVGTGSMNREYWAPVVDAFLSAMRAYDYCGRSFDVRENIKFKGGHFPSWVHRNFPESACCIAVEFKKYFMNEWTGKADCAKIEKIRQAVDAAGTAVMQQLSAVK